MAVDRAAITVINVTYNYALNCMIKDTKNNNTTNIENRLEN